MGALGAPWKLAAPTPFHCILEVSWWVGCVAPISQLKVPEAWVGWWASAASMCIFQTGTWEAVQRGGWPGRGQQELQRLGLHPASLGAPGLVPAEAVSGAPDPLGPQKAWCLGFLPGEEQHQRATGPFPAPSGPDCQLWCG